MNARANPPPAGDSSSDDPADIDQMHLTALACVRRFDHADCVTFPGDVVRYKVNWNGDRSMAEHEDKIVRLEIFLENADLFTIVAE